ncbi:DNA-directed RNA polymerase III subunit RPC7-like [Tubulanus polymorphus]|uniref:DNA-directed RNA polymerase III subunit RPC7-like n=1 Tax=Tubulanus polymorphus TaxID=672921 RepID=UPI003DA36BF5
MAGRGGRGRGRSSLSFNIESLGFGRGEALPVTTLQPPPLYPPTEFKPVPLTESEENAYLLALKQEFRGGIRESPFFIKPLEKKKDIIRYTDKYQQNSDNTINWKPDWRFFPPELKIQTRKAAKIKATFKPKIPQRNLAVDESLVKTLEELEQKEVEGADEEEETEKAKEEENEDEVEDEEYFEEDDLEEETDYNLNYFDNGENYGMDDEDDGLDEGAIY